MKRKDVFHIEILISVSLILAIAIYAIVDIHKSVTAISVLRKQKFMAKDIKIEIENLKSKNERLEHALISLNQHDASEKLMSFFTSEKDNFSFQKMEKPKIIPIENTTILEWKIQLKGRFKAILKCLFKIEREGKLGQISYLEFYKIKDSKNKFELYCSLTINALNRENHE